MAAKVSVLTLTCPVRRVRALVRGKACLHHPDGHLCVESRSDGSVVVFLGRPGPVAVPLLTFWFL